MKRLIVFPNGSVLEEGDKYLVAKFPASNPRQYLRTDGCYTLRACNIWEGSIFIGNEVVENGDVLVAVPFDSFLFVAIFVTEYSSIACLGISEHHQEIQKILPDWECVKTFYHQVSHMSLNEFFTEWTMEEVIKMLLIRFFDDEKVDAVRRTGLYKKIMKDTSFKQKWNVSSEKECVDAFIIELLQEHLPQSIITLLISTLSLSEPKNIPLCKPKPTESESKPTNEGNNKKRTKSQTSMEDEAKTSKRITSFFKPVTK